MFLINKIEMIENVQFRKEIYGMFLIHQENCESHEMIDHNINLDYICPCREIVNYIKILNFHMKFSKEYQNPHNINKRDKKRSTIKEKKNLIKKEDVLLNNENNDLNTNNLENSLRNSNESIIQHESNIEKDKKEENREENSDELAENSENKTIMVINYNKFLDERSLFESL